MSSHELARAMQQDRDRAMARALQAQRHLAVRDHLPSASSGGVAARVRAFVRRPVTPRTTDQPTVAASAVARP